MTLAVKVALNPNTTNQQLLLMHQNEYLWSKGLNSPSLQLNLYQNFWTVQIREHYKINRTQKIVLGVEENICRKGENASYQHFLLFSSPDFRVTLCTSCIVNNSFSSSPKLLGQFGPYLAGMFLGRSSLEIVHRIWLHQKLGLSWQPNGIF